MKKKNKGRIYVCHTFYHVYISCLKELQLLGGNPKVLSSQEKSVLMLSRMSNDFGNLQERAEKSGLFREVIMFDEKEESFFPELASYHQDTGSLLKNMLQRIKYTRLFGKLLEPFIPVDFRDFEDIYVYCDSDPIGYYLSSHKIYYHAVEDGLDCICYYDTARFDNRGHFKLKALLSACNLIFIQNGYSKYCLDMEVNNISILKYPCKKYIESPRVKLLENLDDVKKDILVSIFVENKIELEEALEMGQESGAPMVLVLTEPLCDLETRKKIFEDIICMYETIDGRQSKIILKPHPRDVLDYNRLFPQYIILDKKIPMEILNFVKDLAFEKVISVFTVPDAITYAKEKVFLGEDFMDKYEEPIIHRQNEQIY